MRQWVWALPVAVVAMATGYVLGHGGARPTGVDATRDTSVAIGSAPRATTSAGDAQTIAAVASLPASARTLLDSAAIDLDLDGAAERVELYAAVDRDARGRLVWDDGQPWALVVRDGAAVYPLVEERVQLGHLRFWIVERGDGTAPTIMVLREAGSGLQLRPFTFDAARGVFVAGAPVEASGNVVHASPAKY